MPSEFPNDDLLLEFGTEVTFVDAENVAKTIKVKIDALDVPSTSFDNQVENRTVEAIARESDVGDIDNRCQIRVGETFFGVQDVKFDGAGLVVLTLGAI